MVKYFLGDLFVCVFFNCLLCLILTDCHCLIIFFYFRAIYLSVTVNIYPSKLYSYLVFPGGNSVYLIVLKITWVS